LDAAPVIMTGGNPMTKRGPRNQDRTPPPGTVVVEDDTLTPRQFIMLILSAGALVVSVGVAIAVWKVATGIKWALVILAVGSAGQMLFMGAGVFWRQVLGGRAQLVQAQGMADAARIRAQNQVTIARITKRRPEGGDRGS